MQKLIDFLFPRTSIMNLCVVVNICILFVMGPKTLVGGTDIIWKNYEASCDNKALDPKLLETPGKLTYFETVTLRYCGPPVNESYGQALKSRNIIADGVLDLSHLPAGTVLSAASLKELKMKNLYLSSANGTLVPEPGALADLNTVNVLYLSNVRPDKLPHNLVELDLYNTGYESLPDEAYRVKILMIEEPDLTSMDGVAQNLEVLSIKAPVSKHMRAPNLDSLTLKSSVPNPLPDDPSIGELYLSLRRLDLRQLTWTWIPGTFLLGARGLKAFWMVEHNVKNLSDALFHSSPLLEVIVVRDGPLESLPWGLFTGIVNLRKLDLRNNNLVADTLIIYPVHTLKELYLSGNPLGDLCKQHDTPISIQELYLSNTNAKEVCVQYLRDMNNLTDLHLENNNVRFFTACWDKEEFNDHYVPLRVHLAGNRYVCARCHEATAYTCQTASDLSKNISLRMECHCGTEGQKRDITISFVGHQSIEL